MSRFFESELCVREGLTVACANPTAMDFFLSDIYCTLLLLELEYFLFSVFFFLFSSVRI